MHSSATSNAVSNHRGAQAQALIIAEKLGSSLVTSGRITLVELDRSLAHATPTERPGWHLVTSKTITELEWSQALAGLFGLPSAEMADFRIDRELVKRLPEELARAFHVMPLTNVGDEVYVAITDPTDLRALDELKRVLGAPVRPLVVPPSEIDDALRRHYLNHDVSDVEHLDSEFEDLTAAELAELKSAGSDGQIIELVDRLLAHAVSTGASDIHIEPQPDALKIRFRIDGLLRDGPTYGKALAPWVASRIKVLAKLNIAERFVPQDGRVRTRLRDREIDLRISCLPVAHGEKVVIRLLGHGIISKPLSELGFRDRDLEALTAELARPHGMILITGPTGSGKTTTLYAALQARASSEVNVTTIEDPVEYEIAGFNQVPINTARGVTFGRALRAILRQDPDVILVGEIRDRETGVIAAEAAVTGHLLLSTLHTNDAASAIHRLLEMDVPSHLLAPSLNAVVAQRLVRRVCRHCAVSYEATSDELTALAPSLVGEGIVFNRGEGCEDCEMTGYRGRCAIHEVLVISDAIRALIGAHATTAEIRRASIAGGMSPLRDSALERLFAGETTVEEVYRVTS